MRLEGLGFLLALFLLGGYFLLVDLALLAGLFRSRRFHVAHWLLLAGSLLLVVLAAVADPMRAMPETMGLVLPIAIGFSSALLVALPIAQHRAHLARRRSRLVRGWFACQVAIVLGLVLWVPIDAARQRVHAAELEKMMASLDGWHAGTLADRLRRALALSDTASSRIFLASSLPERLDAIEFELTAEDRAALDETYVALAPAYGERTGPTSLDDLDSAIRWAQHRPDVAAALAACGTAYCRTPMLPRWHRWCERHQRTCISATPRAVLEPLFDDAWHMYRPHRDYYLEMFPRAGRNGSGLLPETSHAPAGRPAPQQTLCVAPGSTGTARHEPAAIARATAPTDHRRSR